MKNALTASILTFAFTIVHISRAMPKDEIAPEHPDHRTLRLSGVGTDAGSVLAHLKKHSGNDTDLLKLDVLIGQLGSDRFEERERAATRIVRLGSLVRSQLKEAAQTEQDKERARLLSFCIEEIERNARPYVMAAAVRQSIRLNSEGIAVALFRFLPYCLDEDLTTDIAYALDAMATKRDVQALLENGLEDPLAGRRAIAACILGHRGDMRQRGKVRRLLTDADPWVRLRAAQGLLAGRDKDTLPSLIALLEGTPVYLAWQAEELLRYVAAEESPNCVLGAGNPMARQACRRAWEQWLRKRPHVPDLGNLQRAGRCPALFLVLNRDDQNAEMASLFGHDGTARWEVKLLDFDLRDALFLRDEAIVICGSPKQRTSEKGLQRAFDDIRLAELNLDGTPRWRVNDPMFRQVTRLVVSPQGNIVFGMGNESLGVFSREGRLLERIDLERTPTESSWGMGCAQLLPSGRMLCSRKDKERVSLAEFDGRNAKPIWQITVRGDSDNPIPLATGNFLLMRVRLAQDPLLPGRAQLAVAETDRDGHIVWSTTRDTRSVLRWRNGNTLLGDEETLFMMHTTRCIEMTVKGAVVREYFLRSLNHKPWGVRGCFELLRLGYDDAAAATVDLEQTPAVRVADLHSRDPQIRCRSAKLIGTFGTAGLREIDALIETLADPDPQVRLAAREGLERSKPEYLSLLIARAKDSRKQVRLGLLNALWAFRETYGDRLLNVYLAAWKDTDRQIRHLAIGCLGGLGLDKKDVLAVLAEALTDDSVIDGESGTSNASTALCCFAQYPDKARLHLTAIIRATQAKDPTARIFAAITLRHFGPEIRNAVPLLIKNLESRGTLEGKDKTDLARHVALTLGAIGRDAKAALPALELLAQDADPELREVANEVIQRIKR